MPGVLQGTALSPLQSLLGCFRTESDSVCDLKTTEEVPLSLKLVNWSPITQLEKDFRYVIAERWNFISVIFYLIFVMAVLIESPQKGREVIHECSLMIDSSYRHFSTMPHGIGMYFCS